MHLLNRFLSAAACLLLGGTLAAPAAPDSPVSPDGKVSAVADGDTIRFFDNASGKEIRALKGHVGAVTGLAFSPDGRRLASGGKDNTVRLWDLPTGKEIWVLKGKAAVAKLSYSADGKTLTVTDEDKAEMKVDAATGKLLP
jgi:WD40 repeat protein